MFAVVDYHKGNLKSVERGLSGVGADARITDDIDLIARAEAIVLPGVGSFADASWSMFELGQMEVIRACVDKGVPFLGICLGLHLMFEEGQEGEIDTDVDEDPIRPKGLAILPGVAQRLPRVDASGQRYKIPHVGWNTVDKPCEDKYRAETVSAVSAASATSAASAASATNATNAMRDTCDTFTCPLLADVPVGEYFYFTHSYVVPDGPFTVAQTTHSTTFPSVVRYKDVAFGVQFHPEKSSDAGVRLLRNFTDIVKGA